MIIENNESGDDSKSNPDLISKNYRNIIFGENFKNLF